MQEMFIQESQIKIRYSPIFKNVTSVKSETKDYCDKIMSGVDGASFYFLIGTIISAICSLLILGFNKNVSVNAFMNIILLNSLLIFYALYLLLICN